MPGELDRLVVRLEADLKPFERALLRAETESNATLARMAKAAASMFGDGVAILERQADLLPPVTEEILGQADAWGRVRQNLDALPAKYDETKQKVLDLDDVARDLGFTFSSAFEDAIVAGEGLSDVLRGLEQDILRILARLLITEPLAQGITAGLQGQVVSGGGLGGLFSNVISSAAGLISFSALGGVKTPSVPLPNPRRQIGGMIHGPGSARSDSIAALLSDGEFVVNAAATRRNRRLLEAINANLVPAGFAERGLAALRLNRGPVVEPIAPRSNRGPAPQSDVHIHFHLENDAQADQFTRGTTLAQLRGHLMETIELARRRDM